MVYHVNIGTYVLKEGDTPRSVAELAYKDGNMYTALTKANLGSNWEPGETVKVPNKKGRETVVEDGESTRQVIQRMFKNDPPHIYFDKFLAWNGGEQAEFMTGKKVYVPER